MKRKFTILRKTSHRVKEYLWTVVIFLLILLVIAIPDLIYYYCPTWWAPGSKPLGIICAIARQNGFSYTGALRVLKNNFGILVTTISVIITMSVNNLNRFENKIFGLTRSEFNFSKRLLLYKYGRRMILFAPLVMIIAVYFNLSILGYGMLMMCYFFIIIAYLLFESSFSRDKDLECIVIKLYEVVPQNAQDSEDIADYRMLLNLMDQWNEKEKYWEGVNFLFQVLCNLASKDDIEKRYILCYCFYETMYVRSNEAECDRAVYALKEYVRHRDRQGWTQEDYLILWGMIHCLFAEGNWHSVLCFFKWYTDFSTRSRKLGEKYNLTYQRGEHCGYSWRIDSQTMRMQMGILLIELEVFFHRFTEYERANVHIMSRLIQIWNEGKEILDESSRMFRKKYLELNEKYNLGGAEIDERLQNLCSDYQYNTTKSMMAYYLKYK